jgi:hypothetical protein
LESIARSATRWFSRTLPGLRQQTVDQGSLSMIDVRNDGNISEVHLDGCFQEKLYMLCGV